MKVVPLGDCVVVKPLTDADEEPACIVLPDSTRSRPLQGRVLSVGDGKLLSDGRRAEHLIREGDRVYFRNHAGTELMVGGEDVLIMHEDDILAVLD
jgi:chaperonin GroES